jgi:hypothetical protein
VAVQEQMTSSFMGSPPPPHLEAPFFGADLIPSGRLRRMRGHRHSPGGLDEEVHPPSRHTKLQQKFVLCLLARWNRISSFPVRRAGSLSA